MIVPDQIARAAMRFGDLPGAICGGETRTIRELDDRSWQLANALLNTGLQPGDRVFCLLRNSIRCIEVDFALAKAGLVRVSVNPRSTAREAGYMIADSEPRAVIYGQEFGAMIEALRPDAKTVDTWIEVGPQGDSAETGSDLAYEALLGRYRPDARRPEIDGDHLYCLFYTSGTTGRPKGVMLTHRSILEVCTNLLLEVGPHRAGEKVLLMQPMSHGAGFFVLPWFVRGGASLIMEDFDAAQTIRLTRLHEIETIKLVPTMLQRILRLDDLKPDDFPFLRQIIYGASPMPAEGLRQALARFGTKLVQVYGQSEAPVALTCLTRDDHAMEGDAGCLSSAGRPWSTVELKVLGPDGSALEADAVGEIAVRAPQVMAGYWKLPELTAKALQDGWLRTGDLGRIDRQGFVYLIGRRDEMIISGGYNIAPREVEEVLYLHPAIREAAVVGEPDPEWGSAVTAYVALREAADRNQILDFVKSHIGFKRPRRIYRVNELPKSANGKIQKNAINPSLALDWDF